jgi:DNA-binding transcriptional LysR family regulator
MNASQRQLEVFVEIYRSRNITRAAERLGLTQSAVSLHLKQLETLFGLRLFDRTTRILHPTGAAERAIAAAERILAATTGLTHEMQNLTQLNEGRLVLVTSAGFASTFLPPLLGRFSERHPGIEVTLYDVPAHQLVEKLLTSEAEIALGSVEGAIPEVSIEPLMHGRMSAIGIDKGDFARKRSVSWDDLESFRTISMGRETRMRRNIESALAPFDRRFIPKLEVSLYITALSLSAAGFGVAILPDYILTRQQFPTLVAKPLVRPALGRQVSLIRKTGRSLSPASSQFVATVRNELLKRRNASPLRTPSAS